MNRETAPLEYETLELGGLRQRLAVIFLPPILLIVLASWLFGSLVDRFIAHTAERKSVDWAEYTAVKVGGLKDIASGGAPSADDLQAINELVHFGDVFRFKVFDDSGKLQFDSSNPNKKNNKSAESEEAENLFEHNDTATSVYRTKTSHTLVEHNTSNENLPEFYSETYLPLIVDAQIVAVIELYLDQTENRAETRDDLLVFGVYITLLLMLGLTTPTAMTLSMSARLRRINHELAYERRQALNRAKMISEFLSTVSHELRTPLTSIKGALDLLQSSDTVQKPDLAKKLLPLASRNTKTMISLVNDILDIQNISAGKVELVVEEAEITRVIDEAAEKLESYAAERNVSVVIEELDSPMIIPIDKHRIEQVIRNLLSNALKFSPPGETVVISAKFIADYIRVSVRDKGPGVPEEQQARIFEKFTQVDSSDTRKVGGTGLGLAIAKGIIELHGGTIGASSPPSGGSIFYFELPWAARTSDENSIVNAE